MTLSDPIRAACIVGVRPYFVKIAPILKGLLDPDLNIEIGWNAKVLASILSISSAMS